MGVIICYSKCWACNFGECDQVSGPHTWMDSEDLEAAGRPEPTSPAAWKHLAAEWPCGCRCNTAARTAAA